MYCKNCGKKINYAAELCDECAKAAGIEVRRASVPPTPLTPVYVYEKPKSGLSKSISGTVFGTIAEVLAIFAFYVMFDCTSNQYYYGGAILALFAIYVGIAAFIFAVLGLIFGTLGAASFGKYRTLSGKRYLPPLIVGLCGVKNAAEALFINTLTLALFITFI